MIPVVPHVTVTWARDVAYDPAQVAQHLPENTSSMPPAFNHVTIHFSPMRIDAMSNPLAE